MFDPGCKVVFRELLFLIFFFNSSMNLFRTTPGLPLLFLIIVEIPDVKFTAW